MGRRVARAATRLISAAAAATTALSALRARPRARSHCPGAHILTGLASGGQGTRARAGFQRTCGAGSSVRPAARSTSGACPFVRCSLSGLWLHGVVCWMRLVSMFLFLFLFLSLALSTHTCSHAHTHVNRSAARTQGVICESQDPHRVTRMPQRSAPTPRAPARGLAGGRLQMRS